MGKDIEYEYEYFYQQARNSGYAIVNMYSSTMDIIQRKIQEIIINNIARNFYSEKAVDCLKNFKWEINYTSDDIAQVFVNLRNQLQSIVNGYEYKENPGRHLTISFIQYKPISIDVDNIVKEKDDSGKRYIKKDLALDVEEWIHQCKNEIKSEIRSLSEDIPTDIYIAGGQSYALRYAMTQLLGIVDGIFGFLSYGENSIYNKISEFENDLKTTETKSANKKV